MFRRESARIGGNKERGDRPSSSSSSASSFATAGGGGGGGALHSTLTSGCNASRGSSEGRQGDRNIDISETWNRVLKMRLEESRERELERSKNAEREAILRGYAYMVEVMRPDACGSYRHECSKDVCGPSNVVSLKRRRLMRPEFSPFAPLGEDEDNGAPLSSSSYSAGSDYRGERSVFGASEFKPSSYKDLERNVYVCDYGVIHVCKSGISSKWFKDAGIPYSRCVQSRSSGGESCCKISGTSLGFKCALPFLPGISDGKNGYGENDQLEIVHDDRDDVASTRRTSDAGPRGTRSTFIPSSSSSSFSARAPVSSTLYDGSDVRMRADGGDAGGFDSTYARHAPGSAHARTGGYAIGGRGRRRFKNVRTIVAFEGPGGGGGRRNGTVENEGITTRQFRSPPPVDLHEQFVKSTPLQSSLLSSSGHLARFGTDDRRGISNRPDFQRPHVSENANGGRGGNDDAPRGNDQDEEEGGGGGGGGEEGENLVTIVRRFPKNASGTRSKRPPCGGGGGGGGRGGYSANSHVNKLKQRRTKKKPRDMKLMHQKLNEKLSKRQRQEERQSADRKKCHANDAESVALEAPRPSPFERVDRARTDAEIATGAAVPVSRRSEEERYRCSKRNRIGRVKERAYAKRVNVGIATDRIASDASNMATIEGEEEEEKEKEEEEEEEEGKRDREESENDDYIEDEGRPRKRRKLAPSGDANDDPERQYRRRQQQQQQQHHRRDRSSVSVSMEGFEDGDSNDAREIVPYPLGVLYRSEIEKLEEAGFLPLEEDVDVSVVVDVLSGKPVPAPVRASSAVSEADDDEEEGEEEEEEKEHGPYSSSSSSSSMRSARMRSDARGMPKRRASARRSHPYDAEEEQMKKTVRDMLMTLFYSDKRTEIYNISIMQPMDKGERAVKAKWTTGIRNYNEYKRQPRGKARKTSAASSNAVVTTNPKDGTLGEGENNNDNDNNNHNHNNNNNNNDNDNHNNNEPPPNPNYIGFNSMLGFTTYRNTVAKHTKIKKTPKLPVNEDFIDYFTKHALLQWKIIKKSPCGSSIIKQPQGRNQKSQRDQQQAKRDAADKTADGKRKPRAPAKKNSQGTLTFQGLCLAMLVNFMRVDTKKEGGRVVIPYCPYVAKNVPQIKDLEEYNPAYGCKLITRSTSLMKRAYSEMGESYAITEADFKAIEKIKMKDENA